MSEERPILVVDDDVDVRLTVADALEWEGFKVSTAANGKEALERVQENPPSLILLDMMMPVMDGAEFLTELRKTGPDRASVPVIIFTAHAPGPEVMKQFGAAGYLNKPPRIDALLDAIREARCAV